QEQRRAALSSFHKLRIQVNVKAYMSCSLLRGQFPQPRRNDLRRDVALGVSQHFKSNHKFPYGRRAQKRGIEMRMKMPFGMLVAVGWRLVKSHRIREGNSKHLVVG